MGVLFEPVEVLATIPRIKTMTYHLGRFKGLVSILKDYLVTVGDSQIHFRRDIHIHLEVAPHPIEPTGVHLAKGFSSEACCCF